MRLNFLHWFEHPADINTGSQPPPPEKSELFLSFLPTSNLFRQILAGRKPAIQPTPGIISNVTLSLSQAIEALDKGHSIGHHVQFRVTLDEYEKIPQLFLYGGRASLVWQSLKNNIGVRGYLKDLANQAPDETTRFLASRTLRMMGDPLAQVIQRFADILAKSRWHGDSDDRNRLTASRDDAVAMLPHIARGSDLPQRDTDAAVGLTIQLLEKELRPHPSLTSSLVALVEWAKNGNGQAIERLQQILDNPLEASRLKQVLVDAFGGAEALRISKHDLEHGSLARVTEILRHELEACKPVVNDLDDIAPSPVAKRVPAAPAARALASLLIGASLLNATITQQIVEINPVETTIPVNANASPNNISVADNSARVIGWELPLTGALSTFTSLCLSVNPLNMFSAAIR